MKNHLREVEKYIQPGFSRYSWVSLGIIDYVNESSQRLKHCKSLVRQSEIVLNNIELRIIGLSEYNLFFLTRYLYDDGSINTCKVIMKKILMLPVKILFILKR